MCNNEAYLWLIPPTGIVLDVPIRYILDGDSNMLYLLHLFKSLFKINLTC